MKFITLALLLTLPVAAQSIPATWPDRMDAKPLTNTCTWADVSGCLATTKATYPDPYANDLVVAGFYANETRIAMCAENEDKTLRDCRIESGHTLDELVNVMTARLNISDAVIKSLMRPPAKHHSTAPTGHKSHARRKVRK